MINYQKHDIGNLMLHAMLIETADFFPAEHYGINIWSCARFYWLPRGSKDLRYAPIVARGDNEKSLCIHYRTIVDYRERMVLHWLLGWTFCCTSEWLRLRCDQKLELNHIDTNHGNNFFKNFELR